MNIQLERPLIFFDIESTGVDVATDRIVSLAALKIMTEDLVTDAFEVSCDWKFNPGIPIPKQASDIHSITDEMVKDWPRFQEHVSEVQAFFAGADLCGFNVINFDVPILWEEFHRSGIEWDLSTVKIVDASEIFRRKEPRTLTAAVAKYCQREHTAAHDAMGDVLATRDVLAGQLFAYPELSGLTVPALAEFSTSQEFDGQPATRIDLAGYLIRDAQGVARYTLKKVRGIAVHDDAGFGLWMLKSAFPENTKAALRQILNS